MPNNPHTTAEKCCEKCAGIASEGGWCKLVPFCLKKDCPCHAKSFTAEKTQPTQDEKIREEFHKFCPGAKENLLIADWWLEKMKQEREVLRAGVEGMIEKYSISARAGGYRKYIRDVSVARLRDVLALITTKAD